jgi:hypothetical protein
MLGMVVDRNTDFDAAYRRLEKRMESLAAKEGRIYLPNPKPDGPVDYVFICMEPSLGGSSPEELKQNVEAGARNFVNSIEEFILHFSARRYLCEAGEQYHITDVSKGPR